MWALVCLVAAAWATGLGALFQRSDGIFYVVAILTGALALAVSGQLERVAWFHSAKSRAAVWIVALASLASLTALGRIAQSPHDVWQRDTFVQALGLLHLGAIALVLHRTRWSPSARAAGLLMLGLFIPALAPTLRPLLDASPSFRDPHLTRLSTALAPILSLIVLAYALPARSPSSAPRSATP